MDGRVCRTGLALVNIPSATYRVRLLGVENQQPVPDAGGSLISASRHQRFLTGPIVPTITSAQRQRVFQSGDRFMLPKFFSKVIDADRIWLEPEGVRALVSRAHLPQ